MIRGPNNALQQVAKRLGENKANEILAIRKTKSKEGSEILFQNEIKSVVHKQFLVSNEPPNNCFMTTDGNFVIIDSIKKVHQYNIESHLLECKTFDEKHNLFKSPIKSRELNIYKLKNLKNTCTITLSQIVNKCVLLPDFSDDLYSICIPYSNSEHFY
jgi:hypothetical protein